VDDVEGNRPSRRPSRRRFIAASAAGLAAGAAASTAGGLGRLTEVASVDRPARRLDEPTRAGWTPEVVGESVERRPIHLWSNVQPAGRFRLLVVAAVHGDERGVGPIGERIVEQVLPDHVDGYLVPIANPDGWHRGTRNNANDVDLNRNFPWWWKPETGGPGPASEPETQTLIRVVEAVRPHLAVWIHQPLAYVASLSPEARPFASAWASAARLRPVFGLSQQGGGESWSYYAAGVPSILVEAPTRRDDPRIVEAQLAGFRALVEAIAP
jgi:protein MpaA